MALTDVRTDLVALLNRKDLRGNPQLADTFLSQGLSRIQRLLRIPSMERSMVVEAPNASVQSFELPSDLLQLQDVYASGVPLERKAFRQIAMMNGVSLTGASTLYMTTLPALCSRYYARVGASLYLAPPMPQGGEIVLTYYGSFAPLVLDTDENEITLACPELLVYAGLSFGADYFAMDQKDAWEARFQSLMQEVQDAANQLDNTGGPNVVQAPHGDY